MTDNAPSRSFRRSGHPTIASAASRLRAFDRDLICGEHYGQRPSKSAATTGRTDGSTDQHCIIVRKSLANRESSTDGYKRRSRARAIYGSSTLSTGSRSPYVGFHENCFGFTPDSGRGWGAALTGSFDPEQKWALP